MKTIRARVGHYSKDHYFAPDIRIATKMVEEGTFLSFMPDGLLPCK